MITTIYERVLQRIREMSENFTVAGECSPLAFSQLSELMAIQYLHLYLLWHTNYEFFTAY